MGKEIRASCIVLNALLILILSVPIQSSTVTHPKTHPKTYIVGDEFGWDLTIDIESWPRGKKFYAGDYLVFNYDYRMADVVEVNKTGHDNCKATDKDRKYESGHDKIQLRYGSNYFICSVPEDCQGGMKLAINARARPPLTSHDQGRRRRLLNVDQPNTKHTCI